jgi:hypothetical protein
MVMLEPEHELLKSCFRISAIFNIVNSVRDPRVEILIEVLRVVCLL